MCSKCNKEVLVDLGRQVNNCAHGDLWCSCKVRQFLGLIGLHELDDDGEEVRYITDWFPKVESDLGGREDGNDGANSREDQS